MKFISEMTLKVTEDGENGQTTKTNPNKHSSRVVYCLYASSEERRYIEADSRLKNETLAETP